MTPRTVFRGLGPRDARRVAYLAAAPQSLQLEHDPVRVRCRPAGQIPSKHKMWVDSGGPPR